MLGKLLGFGRMHENKIILCFFYQEGINLKNFEFKRNKKSFKENWVF